MTLSNLGTNPDTPAGVSIERWTATSGSERGSRASLVLHGGDHRWRANAEGNGAIDALMKAVDVALAPLLATAWPWRTYDVHASGPGTTRPRRSRCRSAPRRRGLTPLSRACRQRERARGLVGAYVDAINAPRRHRRRHRFRRPITRRVEHARDRSRPPPTARTGSCRPTTTESLPHPPAFARGARNRESALGGLSTAGRLRRGASLDRNGARTRSAMAEVRN